MLCNMPKMLNYVGKGAFLIGVPARTMTEDEASQYGLDRLLTSGLYEYETEQPPRERASRTRTRGAVAEIEKETAPEDAPESAPGENKEGE